jgi:predicted Zn-dependent protease with MMP-like domain
MRVADPGGRAQGGFAHPLTGWEFSPLCGGVRMPERAEFERLVAEALDGIPAEFVPYLANVAVVIEDEPDPRLLRELDLDPGRDTLYGVYQGVPLSERAHDHAALPDRIVIFAGPLARDCRSRPALRREIRATVIHEIAHFFGLDDRRIRRLGY